MPLIFLGGLVFGGLFAALAMMAERTLEGEFRITPLVVGLGMAAFIGYVGAALIVRRDGADGSDG